MATVTETPAPTSARRSVGYWLVLAAAIMASIVLRLIVNTKFQAPTILTDELTYAQLAKNIANGQFSLSTGYGVIYPLLLAPSWALTKYGTDAYTYMKATNAVIVSLTAIPVFLWARRMMRPRYALLAAVLTLLMPSLGYSGTIMTENAFLLFFMLAAWAISVAVERPTILNQLLVLVALVLAFETRAQAVVLLAALPLIIVLHVLAEERATNAFSLAGCGRRLLRFWPLVAVAALGVLAIVVRTLATSWHVSQLLQAYSATTGGQYTPQNVSRYFLWHLGEATFALGAIPVAALLLLVGMGILNRSRSSAERAYLCTALIAAPLVVLQVAVFTSYWSHRVSERNMFCVFPIVLIGLALWLDLQAPRPRRVTAIAAAIAGVLVLSIPFGYLYPLAPSTETWAVVLPQLLTRHFAMQGWDVQVLITVGVAVALLVFGITRTRLAALLVPLLLVGYFAVAQFAAVHEVARAAADYRAVPSLGQDADWLDRTVPEGASVALITGSTLGPDTDRLLAWQMSFFSKTPLTWLVWGANLVANPLTGAVTAPDGGALDLPSYVVTPTSARFADPVLAVRGPYALQQPTRPYQLESVVGGVLADGWTAGTVTVDVYRPRQGTAFNLQLARPDIPPNVPPATVTVRIGALGQNGDGSLGITSAPTTRTAVLQPNGDIAFTLQPPQKPFRVEITIDPTFTPSAFGGVDTRELGAKLRATYGSSVIVG